MLKTYEQALQEVCENLIFFEETDSTNTRAGVLAKQGAPHNTIVVAECQNAGKGRKGRQWTSPKGTGIWMSLLLRPQIRPENASMLTLVMGLSVAKACERLMPAGVGIKWPNDVLIGKKKVCGILTEMQSQNQRVEYIVVGSGLNVNMTQFPAGLSERATSLYLESGQQYDRAKVLKEVLKAFRQYYDIFLQSQSFTALREEYNQILINAGREVRLTEGGLEYTGRALGIDGRGALLVQKSDGECIAVNSGEVSVRGLEGYV